MYWKFNPRLGNARLIDWAALFSCGCNQGKFYKTYWVTLPFTKWHWYVCFDICRIEGVCLIRRTNGLGFLIFGRFQAFKECSVFSKKRSKLSDTPMYIKCSKVFSRKFRLSAVELERMGLSIRTRNLSLLLRFSVAGSSVKCSVLYWNVPNCQITCINNALGWIPSFFSLKWLCRAGTTLSIWFILRTRKFTLQIIPASIFLANVLFCKGMVQIYCQNKIKCRNHILA